MKTVGLRQMNQQFSRYLKAVRDGEEILITDRGKPVAIVRPVVEANDLEDKLRHLELTGVLTRSVKLARIRRRPRVRVSGEPLSETISRMRDEREAL